METNNQALSNVVKRQIMPCLQKFIRALNLKYNKAIDVKKALNKHYKIKKGAPPKKIKKTNILDSIKDAQDVVAVKFCTKFSSFVMYEKYLCTRDFIVLCKINDDKTEELVEEDYFFLKSNNIEFKVPI